MASRSYVSRARRVSPNEFGPISDRVWVLPIDDQVAMTTDRLTLLFAARSKSDFKVYGGLFAAFLLNFVRDLLTLIETVQPGALDGADMDEYVLAATVRLNEAGLASRRRRSAWNWYRARAINTSSTCTRSKQPPARVERRLGPAADGAAAHCPTASSCADGKVGLPARG